MLNSEKLLNKLLICSIVVVLNKLQYYAEL